MKIFKETRSTSELKHSGRLPTQDNKTIRENVAVSPRIFP